MDLYEELKLKPVRAEPDVWVSRLVIYESISPEPVVIRDITLSRGLNIIWAEETEDRGSSAEITGHSAGKTTFCRLFRYVLGETTFGTKANMELIRKTLPEGYVAAELHVAGQKWAVLRPIGAGRSSYIKQDATVEDIVADHKKPAYHDDYPKKIGLDALLDNLETGAVVRTGEPIEWGHLLAWCTRDQETRFQSIHDWRSPRSESGTSEFRFPKAGPLFVMRTVLGLFLRDELEGEEELADLQKKKDKLEKELEERRREPQFRVNLYDTELRNLLRKALPGEADIETVSLRSDELFPDLHRLTTKATEGINTEIAELDKERAALQGEIGEIGARIRLLEDQSMAFEQVLGVDRAARGELDAGLAQRQERRRLLDEYGNILCALGGVLYRDCEYVQKRQHVLQMTSAQDANTLEQEEAQRAEEQTRLREGIQRLRGEADRLKRERQTPMTRQNALQTGIGEKRESLRDLERAREALEVWTRKLERPGGYEELDKLRGELEAVSRKIGQLEQRLAGLLAEHSENRDRLAVIFSGAIKAVLPSGGYDGRVSLDNRELTFSITHGPAMSGEAVETLAVLLADVSCLVYNTVSDRTHLPGFVVHDSPREADLELGLYASFIRFLASLQAHFDHPQECPFQYILTTTTAPPKALRGREFVKLKLSASEESQLLLRRNIASAADNDSQSLLVPAEP